jgi:2-polyprenyl-6-hydroxyphenyl methylase/3-demethylubiquinone-9 3-methyltransferase
MVTPAPLKLRRTSRTPAPGGSDTISPDMATADTAARFQFGENWARFLAIVDETRIHEAARRLSEMLGDISGKSFLDIGSGSGIHSLAALKLGASRVVSFDYDNESVACTSELKSRFAPNADWTVRQGSVLDEDFMRSLGQFDVVYAWGVLHHTGQMWRSFELVTIPAKHTLMVAVYNDQGLRSRLWHKLKYLHCKSPRPIKFLLTLLTFVITWGKAFVFKPRRAFRNWRNYYRNRGMSAWRDVVDWAGGYPFEVAKPGDVFTFFHSRGFSLEALRTDTGVGNNEFVFNRITTASYTRP